MRPKRWMEAFVVLVAILTVPLNSWSAAAREKPASERVEKKITKVHPSRPVLEFHLIWKRDAEAGETIKRIDVYRKETGEFVQGLEVAGLYDMERERYFGLVDANFDGFKDFWLVTSIGATGNVSLSFWLYDPATNKFKQDEALSGLARPDIDEKKKEITTFGVFGCAGMCFFKNTYKYLDGKLTLIRQDEQTQNNDMIWVYIVRERRGKDMVEVYRGTPIDDSEAEAFIKNWLDLSEKNENLGAVMGLYADEVDFYKLGRGAKSAVANDKMKYFERWPTRKYEVKTFTIVPVPYHVVHERQVNLVFHYSIGDGRKSLAGDADTMLWLRKQNDNILIVSEKAR